VSEQSPKPDIAAMARKSRQRACELLGLDPSSLRPPDEILVNRVGALRVLVTDYEAAQLRGERIDVAEYVRASEALEALVRADRRLIDGSPAAEEDARNRMREVLSRIAPEIVAQSDAEDAAVERAELAAEAPEPEPDLPADPEPSPKNVVPFPPVEQPKYYPGRTPDGRPPPHYLKQDDSSGGTIMPPFFPLDPTR
jgi:hypothetical protein